MHNSYKNFTVFQALLRRDMKLLYTNISSILLDCLPILILQLLVFGYLFPLFGMPSSMIAPTYLGSMLSLFLQLGFTLAVKTGFDLEYGHTIDYHLGLPITKRWLFASYIVSQMIEMAVISFPLFTIGVAILHSHFAISAMSLLGIACIFLLMLLFFTTFFLAIAYTFNITWILDNIWPRFLTPMWLLSSTFVLWKKTHVWSAPTAYIMLASPMTYIAEGVRSAFIGGNDFIAWQICALVLVVFIVINCVCLSLGMKKRLDPV